MRVLKFGGTSVANPTRIREVTEIILTSVKEDSIVVVVSAFQHISSQLLLCAQKAAASDDHYQIILKEIEDRHLQAIEILIPEKNNEIIKTVSLLLAELAETLQGIFLLKELTLGALDNIASFGERLSANIIASFINQFYPTEFVDTRKLIITDDHHTQATVLFEPTNLAIREYYNTTLLKGPLIPVMTGFIGSTKQGKTTTLGRNSSDYSAVIIGAALDATQIEIWTDVNGIYSADPALVSSAFVVPKLSYAEAIELSYFGAKVIHHSTLLPVHQKEIPIVIKNTLNPNYAGTLIAHEHENNDLKKWKAKSISVIDDISLLIWQGTGVSDVACTVERLFKALMLAKINIFLILEASPKHTISLAISHKDLEKARLAIHQEFYFELQHQLFHLEEKSNQSIIAIIGDDMKKLSPIIAGKMFQLLGKMHINVNAVLQGASERNLSLVLDTNQRTRALNLIHQAFFVKHKCLSLILIGTGNVGKEVVKQLHDQRRALLQKKIHISIVALTNSKNMIIDPKGLNLENWHDHLLKSNLTFEVSTILKSLSQIECSNIALIDCTASNEIVNAYPLFIHEGVHIITPNKRANVLPYPQYQALMEQFKRYDCHFLCRTNVGAGLPVLTVLADLIACGDTIIKIEGIFSGTLSYLFNHYDGTEPFGNVLRKTHRMQMTEPDPREDLSGIDVARKLLIMARHMGWKLNIEDIEYENLVPETLLKGKFSEKFFDDFNLHEEKLLRRLQRCQDNKTVLRYVGVLEEGIASAKLVEIPLDHPLALVCHSDNIIAFTTHRYQDIPLVIRGPGAGVDVTAMGVFSDILKLTNYLPG